jgi:translation initiation factor 1
MDLDFSDEEENSKIEDIHIRIQQRNGKKSITTIQGIDDKYDLKKIMNVLKKEFACNGCIINDDNFGEIIQLQGDQRSNVSEFLSEVGICKANNIKIHGF